MGARLYAETPQQSNAETPQQIHRADGACAFQRVTDAVARAVDDRRRARPASGAPTRLPPGAVPLAAHDAANAAVTVLGKRVPWRQPPDPLVAPGEGRAAVLEKRLKNMPQKIKQGHRVKSARGGAGRSWVDRQSCTRRGGRRARPGAEAKAARLIRAFSAYDTAEGERILKERLDGLAGAARWTRCAPAEAKNERLVAENAAATQELNECRREADADTSRPSRSCGRSSTGSRPRPSTRSGSSTTAAASSPSRKEEPKTRRGAKGGCGRCAAGQKAVVALQHEVRRLLPQGAVKSARRRRRRFRKVAPRQPAAAARDGRDLRGAPAAAVLREKRRGARRLSQ